MENLQLALSAAVGVIAGAIVALKYIAPKTKTDKDDKVLARLVQLEDALSRLLGLDKPVEGKPEPEKKA